jgi:Flp pilus assembly pilin Flp
MVWSFFIAADSQHLVEYVLIRVLFTIVVIGVLMLLGSRVSQVLAQLSNILN